MRLICLPKLDCDILSLSLTGRGVTLLSLSRARHKVVSLPFSVHKFGYDLTRGAMVKEFVASNFSIEVPKAPYVSDLVRILPFSAVPE